MYQQEKAQIEAPMAKAIGRIASRSTGSSGAGWLSWRRTSRTPATSPPSISQGATQGCGSSRSTPRKISPSAATFSTALCQSKRCRRPPVSGSAAMPMAMPSRLTGTFSRNSACQGATARIAAAIEGAEAPETATTVALMPIARPSMRMG